MRRSLGPTARYIRVAATAAALSVSLSSGPAAAIDLVIVNTDPPGVGLNDTTPVAPVGGNLATTLGAQRLAVLREAARIWGLALPGTIPIKVTASFSTLPCVSFAAALGATEPTAVFANFNGAPLRDTFYPKALADTLAGRELNPSNSAIDTRFNAGIGQPGCLAGSPFYLGFDNAHGSSIDLLTVALHEFAHGLGFESGADENGTFAGGPWIYDRFVFDGESGRTWDLLATDADRKAAATNAGKLAWSGASANGAAARVLTRKPRLFVSPDGRPGASFEIGSGYIGPRLTDPGDSGRLVAVTPPDGCAPRNEDVGGRIVILDRGACGIAPFVKNVQAAGGVGIVVASIAPGPPGSIFETDPPASIPVVPISQDDGTKLKSLLPARGTLGLDTAARNGTDDAGRLLLFAPDPYAAGSSVSHFDLAASPHLLMQPSVSPTLPQSLDVTPSLFRDLGWFALLSGPAATYVLPSSAHAQGRNGAFYTTDLVIANRGTADASITIQFLGHDRDGSTGPRGTSVLEAGRSVAYPDVLGGLFGLRSDDYGGILILSDSQSLKAVGITSTPAPSGGTFGHAVPAQGGADFVTPSTPRSILGIRQDSAFHTNAVFTNATTRPAHVDLTLLSPDGSTLGSTSVDLQPLEMTQINDLPAVMGGTGITGGVLVVSTASPGAQIATYATVIDNTTNDPRALLP